MSEKVIPPPSLRSSSPLSQGDKGNGERKGENGKLRVSESRSKVYFDYAESLHPRAEADSMNQRSTLSQVKAENGKLFMVGTRHAVSEKQRTIGFGMPFPSVAMEIATLTRHKWTFSQSSKYPLCPPETGGRAKRRGYDKKRKRKGEYSHTPSGTPFLVAPILGGQKKRKTES